MKLFQEISRSLGLYAERGKLSRDAAVPFALYLKTLAGWTSGHE